MTDDGGPTTEDEAWKLKPTPLADPEKERIRWRERALLIDDIKREVLREIRASAGDRAAYRQYLRSWASFFWAEIYSAVLRAFAPERAIEHIESHMSAEDPEKRRAYWCGKSGARMQAQLRALYRRCRRD